MRRPVLVPLVSVGLLAVMLMPSIALGLAGNSGDRAAGSATGGATGPATPADTEAQAAMAKTEHSTATPASLTGLGASAAPSLEPKAPDATHSPQPRTVGHQIHRIRLDCELVRPVDAAQAVGPAVACRWSAVDHEKLRGYQLWRAVDSSDGARRLIATIPAGDPLRHVDHMVSTGHAYTYVVLAIASDGATIARSGPTTVRIPPPLETLRLACELASNGDQRGVACRWSEAKHPAAAGYVLWRSVDGGAREKIYRTGLDGRRGFFDAEVRPGQVIRYAVVVVDKAGERVGYGGPATVRIPPPLDVKPDPTDEVAPADGSASVGSRG